MMPLAIAHVLTKLAPPPKVMFPLKLFFTQQYCCNGGKRAQTIARKILDFTT